MRSFHRWFAAPLTAMVLIAVGGCGDTDGSGGPPLPDNTYQLDASKDQITVNGTVTVGGKLMTEGDVILDPKTSSRSDVETVKAPIGKDGTYTGKTYVGTNHISVSAPGMSDPQKAGAMTKILQPTDTKVDVVIP